jgi:hypothetical protein
MDRSRRWLRSAAGLREGAAVTTPETRAPVTEHAVTPAEWELLMRLDDVLPKGHPDHRLVIEVGLALVTARHEAAAQAERDVAVLHAAVRRYNLAANIDPSNADGYDAAEYLDAKADLRQALANTAEAAQRHDAAVAERARAEEREEHCCNDPDHMSPEYRLLLEAEEGEDRG